MHFIATFFAGVLLCNSLPHLVAGLQGMPFPTPFAKPRGVGDSPPLLNFLWGLGNAMFAAALLAWAPLDVGFNCGSLVFVLGAAAIGSYLAVHFGKVRTARRAA